MILHPPLVAPHVRYNAASFETPLRSGNGLHHATDMYAARGTLVLAPAPGVVELRNTRETQYGGFAVRIRGDDGEVHYFSHLDGPGFVPVGKRVAAGQPVGAVGDSGETRVVHLHYSLKDRTGRPRNAFLDLARVQEPPVPRGQWHWDGPITGPSPDALPPPPPPPEELADLDDDHDTGPEREFEVRDAEGRVVGRIILAAVALKLGGVL